MMASDAIAQSGLVCEDPPVLQVLETYVGITVIRTVLKGFEPLPDDLFRTSFGWVSSMTDSIYRIEILLIITSCAPQPDVSNCTVCSAF